LAEIISSDVALLVTFNQAIAYLRFTAAVGDQASENLSPDVPLVFRKCTRGPADVHRPRLSGSVLVPGGARFAA